jgi:hypothetical protein
MPPKNKNYMSSFLFPLSPYHFLFFPLCSSSFLPLPLINATPLLTIIRAASFLHYITHKPREKPPHALLCSRNGEIPVAKMTANKTKIKPQKHVVFTPVR